MNFKNIISVFLIFILTFGMCSIAFATDDIPNGYTPIYSAEDLYNIRNNLSDKYILMNDIDLSYYENWVPIGTSETPFYGKFDGNSFTVKNISISKIEGKNPSVGLFGTVTSSQIKNVTVVGQIDVSNDNGIRAGMICGEAYNSVITNCITYGKVNMTTKAGVWVGGITGYLSTYSNTDEVKECRIELCKNNASVTTNGICNQELFGLNYFVGGLVGFSDGTISKCSNYGCVTATEKNGGYDYFYTLAGGICGNTGGNINNCYNVGDISSVGTKYVFAGGITGCWYPFEDIYNCYNIGQVKVEVKEATDKYNYSAVGGIIGVVESLVFPDSSDSFANYPASIRNCYYLDNVEKAFGETLPDNRINVKSLDLEEFSKQSSFEGFDFENVWKMSATENRPVLQSENDSDSDIMLPPGEDIEVSIVYMPLKSRIIYNKLGPNLDGMIIKITYFDGRTEILKVKKVENAYKAGNFSISSYCFFLEATGQCENYGAKEVSCYVSKYENNVIYEGVTNYTAISIPNITEFFNCIKTIVNNNSLS